MFRSVDQLQAISAERLTDRSVSRIVKGRMRKHFNSGHSMRAGYESCAAAKDIPSYRIREHTQHKSPAALEGFGPLSSGRSADSRTHPFREVACVGKMASEEYIKDVEVLEILRRRPAVQNISTNSFRKRISCAPGLRVTSVAETVGERRPVEGRVCCDACSGLSAGQACH